MPVIENNIGLRHWMLQCFQAGIDAVRGDNLVCQALTQKRPGKLRLIAVGKAAASMTAGAFAAARDDIQDALVISKSGHMAMLPEDARITVIEAGHPIPDHNSLQAGAALVERLSTGTATDQWLILLSGGASSLVEVLPEGYNLEDLQRLNDWLLASGLAIGDMNAIRQRTSLIKGGRANRNINGQVEVWAISDVPQDDPAVIGSGLFYGFTPLAEGLALPDWINAWIQQARGEDETTTAPSHHILANLDQLLNAMATFAKAAGFAVYRSSKHFTANAERLGREFAAALLDGPEGIYIWGGESSMKLPENAGEGGRNQQLALAAAEVLAGQEHCLLLAIGSDGSDGPTDAAGALVDDGTLARAELEGFSVRQALQQANAYPCLAASGDLIETGPTGTNVTDVVLGVKVAG